MAIKLFKVKNGLSNQIMSELIDLRNIEYNLRSQIVFSFGAVYTINYGLQSLRILTGKKHPKIKFQRLRKIRIWTFGSLVHQINFLRGSKSGTNFPKK